MRHVIAAFVLFACRADGDHKPAEASPSRPPDVLVSVPSGTYRAKLLRYREDGICTPEMAAWPWFDEEQLVAGFEIDKNVATLREYSACIEAHACTGEKLTFDGWAILDRKQAADYCAWRGMRLPTYLEWQAAARGKRGLVDMGCGVTYHEQNYCRFTSEAGIVIHPMLASGEWTRSEECWSSTEARPSGGLGTVRVYLWDRRLDEIIPTDPPAKGELGNVRCVRDLIAPSP